MQQTRKLDLANILGASVENKWVAIAPDYGRVLASADDLAHLMRQVSDQAVIFHRVLPRDVSFVPTAA